ncbi:response regulator [candidate division KSB1 bacterium]|nr:response regulator [candidate division KSB1 bacterium]
MNQTEIARQINGILFSLMFDNIHTLHPRRLRELGDEESKAFLRFLTYHDLRQVSEFGKKRAHEGLSLKSILSIGSFLNQFCAKEIGARSSDLLQVASKSINICLTEYTKGYFAESRKQTLQQQKELSRVLSNALAGQRRELLIRNHAINASINAILLADFEGKVTYVNSAFLSLLGYSDIDEVQAIENVGVLVDEKVEKIFKSLPQIKNWRGELKIERNALMMLEVEMFASVIQDEGNNLIGAMASFVDITERKRLEAQFRQAQKMDALGHLAGGIAHDFNNLLTAIGGYLELISLDADKSSQLYKDIMQIKVAVDRGSGLTKQLRYFAREASGERTPVNLNSLIIESHDLYKLTFPPEINIILKLESELWTIDADPSRISHVLMNFCVNARDAIQENNLQKKPKNSLESADGTVTIQTQNVTLDDESASRFLKASPGQYVCLSIADTGIGMSDKVIDRVFEPFFTTKKDQKGTGLGLSIVYGIIEKHKGFIDIQSKLGEGTTFKVYFPVSVAADIIPHDRDARPASISSKEAVKVTILVVDDESQILNLVSRILKKCGYEVITAKSGKNALSIYEKQNGNISLVILDMIMPEIGARSAMK